MHTLIPICIRIKLSHPAKRLLCDCLKLYWARGHRSVCSVVTLVHPGAAHDSDQLLKKEEKNSFEARSCTPGLGLRLLDGVGAFHVPRARESSARFQSVHLMWH